MVTTGQWVFFGRHIGVLSIMESVISIKITSVYINMKKKVDKYALVEKMVFKIQRCISMWPVLNLEFHFC